MTKSATPKLQTPKRDRNASATQAKILNAARSLFAKESYDDVGLRDIGFSAGVDAALICRYFGSKEELFVAALNSGNQDPDLYYGTSEEFAERMAELLVDQISDIKLESFLMILQSATSQRSADIVQDYLNEKIYTPLQSWLKGKDAVVRSQLIASLMLGVALSRTLSSSSECSLNKAQKKALQKRLAEVFVYCAKADL